MPQCSVGSHTQDTGRSTWANTRFGGVATRTPGFAADESALEAAAPSIGRASPDNSHDTGFRLVTASDGGRAVLDSLLTVDKDLAARPRGRSPLPAAPTARASNFEHLSADESAWPCCRNSAGGLLRQGSQLVVVLSFMLEEATEDLPRGPAVPAAPSTDG